MNLTPIQKLIVCDGDFPELLVRARNYLQSNETFETPLLSNKDIRHVLELYLNGVIRAEDVAEWAEFFDGGEYVDFVHKDTADHLFLLSTPEINEELTPQSAKSLLAGLIE